MTRINRTASVNTRGFHNYNNKRGFTVPSNSSFSVKKEICRVRWNIKNFRKGRRGTKSSNKSNTHLQLGRRITNKDKSTRFLRPSPSPTVRMSRKQSSLSGLNLQKLTNREIHFWSRHSTRTLEEVNTH